jgi:anti-anti-sigma factor
MAGELDVDLIYDGSAARVLFTGRLNGDAADVVREVLGPLWHRTGTRITVDLSGVELIDIAGLALLLRMDVLARAATSTIMLAGVPAGLDRLLRETGLRFRFDREAGGECRSGAPGSEAG